MSKQVKTTQTYTDANLKLKEIQLKINEHKSAEQVAKGKVDELVDSIEDLKKRKNEIEQKISAPFSDLDNSIKQSCHVMQESILAMNSSMSIADSFIRLIKKLSEKISLEEENLKYVIEGKNEVMKRVSAEESRLSKVREDLEIYRKRLQKKIDAYGFSDEIKIII